MTRNDVHDLVIKNMRLNIDNLEGVDIDPSRSMAAYGASSIDMVEVVAATMRKLRIRVPRTRLITLENIDQLTDLLHRYMEEESGPQESGKGGDERSAASGKI